MAAANVVLISAITDGDVEITIRAESKPTGVMIFVRHVQLEENPLGGGICGDGFLVRGFEFRQVNGEIVLRRPAAAQRSGVVGVELAVLLKIGMESQAYQPSLVEALFQLRQF